MVDIIIRILTILLFVARNIYWFKKLPSARKNIPLHNSKLTLQKVISAITLPLLEIFIVLQFFVYRHLYSFSQSIFTEGLGFFIAFTGLCMCIVARKTLGDSWTNAYEYEPRPLVTSGIYGVIRHPIYLGFALMLIGGEIVAGSYLFLSCLAFFLVYYFQGKREEKILLAHFGKKYKDYMNRTKMLIPYIL